MNYNNIIEYPITKEQLQDVNFVKNFYKKKNEQIIINVTNKFVDAICNNVILTRISDVCTFRQPMPNNKCIFNFEQNRSGLSSIKSELQKEGYYFGNFNMQFNNEDNIVFENILNRLEEKFPGVSIHIDPLKTYIIIDWS